MYTGRDGKGNVCWGDHQRRAVAIGYRSAMFVRPHGVCFRYCLSGFITSPSPFCPWQRRSPLGGNHRSSCLQSIACVCVFFCLPSLLLLRTCIHFTTKHNFENGLARSGTGFCGYIHVRSGFYPRAGNPVAVVSFNRYTSLCAPTASESAAGVWLTFLGGDLGAGGVTL